MRNFLSDLRSAFYSRIEGTGLSAAEIGLTTSADYTSGGQIMVDKERLRQALESDPDKVARMFTNVSESEDPATKYAESGLVVRMSDRMLAFTKQVNEITLQVNSRAVKEADDRLTRLQKWIYDNENKYWTRFTAMETAMTKLNNQTSWLSTMISSMSNNSTQ